MSRYVCCTVLLYVCFFYARVFFLCMCDRWVCVGVAEFWGSVRPGGCGPVRWLATPEDHHTHLELIKP